MKKTAALLLFLLPMLIFAQDGFTVKAKFDHLGKPNLVLTTMKMKLGLAVQPPYTLSDMDPRAIHVLRTRRDIACVLVNPLQVLHPNRAAPGDSSRRSCRGSSAR